MKKQEWFGDSKKLHGFRTFPHSNSKRELEERSKQDEQEAREYTTDFVANHFSRDEYPDVYENLKIQSIHNSSVAYRCDDFAAKFMQRRCD